MQVVYDIYSKCFYIWCIMILDCLRFEVLYRKKEFIEIKKIFFVGYFFFIRK